MNALGIALLWCVVQVTVLGLLSGALYLILRRLRPAAAAPVVLTGLLTVVLLSALALAPWPRWQRAQSSRSQAAESSQSDDSTSFGSHVGWDSVPTGSGQSPNLPSSDELPRAVLWWETLWEELSLAQPVAPETPLRWPAVVAVALLIGMAAGVGWLLLGLLAVRSQRARSRPVEDRDLLGLVDALWAELGCRPRLDDSTRQNRRPFAGRHEDSARGHVGAVSRHGGDRL